MQEIFALLQQAGPSKACVLITGESGTGKELVARTLHALSPRRQGPFVAINCAALPETLIESELFGHEKGSFTGRLGTARRAASKWRSTARCCWMKSARCRCRPRPNCCASWKIRRCGGWAARLEFEVDVRVVAATNKVPEEAVRGGHLREDLYYRLNVFHIHLPPLREHKDDIRSIADALLGDLNRKHDCRVTDMSPAVIEALERHNWPGNVRELRNVLERAVILAGEGTIERKHLPAFLQNQAATVAVPVASLASSGCGAGGGWSGRRTRSLPDRHDGGRSREGPDSAYPGAHAEQQDARRRDPGDQPEDPAQQIEGVRSRKEYGIRSLTAMDGIPAAS